MSEVRRSLLLPSIATAVVLVFLVALGAWQLQRLTWKENLIATLDARLTAAPVALPPRSRWETLDQDSFEFSRVTVTADLLTDQPALVYTHGSSMRTDVKDVGFWVFVPARLADGSVVVVNRGFVPENRRDAAAAAPTGPLTIVGVVRWPEPRGLFIPDGDRGRNTWFTRDQRAIAADKDWGAVAPFYIEQEAPPNPGGLPQVGQLVPMLPNNHLQYALTWLGLALVLVVTFAVWVRGQRKPSSL